MGRESCGELLLGHSTGGRPNLSCVRCQKELPPLAKFTVTMTITRHRTEQLVRYFIVLVLLFQKALNENAENLAMASQTFLGAIERCILSARSMQYRCDFCLAHGEKHMWDSNLICVCFHVPVYVQLVG